MKSTLTERERKINQRLDEINRAPYFEIFMIITVIFCIFALVVLLGVF